MSTGPSKAPPTRPAPARPAATGRRQRQRTPARGRRSPASPGEAARSRCARGHHQAAQQRADRERAEQRTARRLGGADLLGEGREQHRERAHAGERQRRRGGHRPQRRGPGQVPQAGQTLRSSGSPAPAGVGIGTRSTATERDGTESRGDVTTRGSAEKPGRERPGQRRSRHTGHVVRRRLRPVGPGEQRRRAPSGPISPVKPPVSTGLVTPASTPSADHHPRRRVPGAQQQPTSTRGEQQLVGDERPAPVPGAVQPGAQQRAGHQRGQRQRRDQRAGERGRAGPVEHQQHHRDPGRLVRQPGGGAAP